MIRYLLFMIFVMAFAGACSIPATSQAGTPSDSSPTEIQFLPAADNELPAYPAPGQPKVATYPAGQVPLAPSDAPAPQSDKAAISGILFSYTIRQTIPETAFYLTPAVGPDQNEMPPMLIGPRPEIGDISGRSANDGQIAMNDIPAGNYFLVVWAPYNWVIAQVSDADNAPLLLELSANQALPLGVIFLSWP